LLHNIDLWKGVLKIAFYFIFTFVIEVARFQLQSSPEKINIKAELYRNNEIEKYRNFEKY